MATNFEFYKDEILKLTSGNKLFVKQDGKLMLCEEMGTCKQCDFGGLCESNRYKWLYAEYIGPLKLTKRERAFCEIVGNKVLARDEDWYHVDSKGELVHGARSDDEAYWKCSDVMGVIHKVMGKLPIQEWVSVDERLPEVPDEYCVIIKGAKRATWLSYEGNGLWVSEYGEPFTVTHWQPFPIIPQPPKGVQ